MDARVRWLIQARHGCGRRLRESHDILKVQIFLHTQLFAASSSHA